MKDFTRDDVTLASTATSAQTGESVWIVSPYHGGSHAAWANGLARHSGFAMEAFTLPARFWKWRMHGGAVTLAREALRRGSAPNLIVATDMLDLTTFLSLTRRHYANAATLLYMHENQLTYPLPLNGDTGPMRRQRGERDLHYAFINYASMLAADHIVFNSDYHRQTMIKALSRFLRRFPEHRELQTVGQIADRSSVLPVGVDWQQLQESKHNDAPNDTDELAPLILWNQRWEYDKNPGEFFAALDRLAEQGHEFRVAVCGQNFRRQPSEFTEAIERLGQRVIHVGFADQTTYHRLLWESEITISTAIHEFFGVSIVEAIACATLPVLPRRLSYPELIPNWADDLCLYDNQSGLLARLKYALENRDDARAKARRLAATVRRFAWQRVAPAYDAVFAELISAYPVEAGT
ncbi:MAG: DUF3524 domain-containing protein [Candidatus Promineifilaceae bacterium]|nr:DUF3524 domain-containing protein [Candidatus Promineifilaceae bacterium]